ncbi:hypothetical protein AB4Y32_25365 [Paraburkholderia phymatum]|uniref:Uncharacterized protein n=1 Tax=Paraburkholderia phymatum TaxID=148447 RepID=A0ACC6U5T6_9BURK
MSWASVKNVVASLAPTIATCVGGPLAGMGVTALEKVFGITPGSDASTDDRQDVVAAAISGATPEQLANVRKADQDFQVQMASLGYKDVESIAALRVQDVQSARSMLTATRSWVPAALTGFLTTAVTVLVGMLFFSTVPEANKEAFFTSLGSIITAWLVSVHFWFGDTLASNDKTRMIAQAQPVGV